MDILDYIKQEYEYLERELELYINSVQFDDDVERILNNDDTIGLDFARECAVDQKVDEMLEDK